MSKKIEVEIYTAEELKEEFPSAFEHAHDRYTSTSDIFGLYEIQHTLEKAAEILRFEITSYELGYRSHIYWRYGDNNQENLEGPRLLSWVWNNCPQLFPHKLYWNNHPIGDSRCSNRRSKFIRGDYDGCPLTGYWCDCEVTLPVYALWDSPFKSKTYEQLIDEICSGLATDAEKEYEWAMSDDYFIEECAANDWMFDAEGRKYCVA